MARVRIVNDSIVGRYQSLTNAGAFVPRFITKLTSITNARVREAPGVDRVMRELHEFVDTHPAVTHNASFDRKFLEAEWLRLRLPLASTMLCTLQILWRLYPRFRATSSAPWWNIRPYLTGVAITAPSWMRR